MTTTLYPDGVSNAILASLGAAYPAPDPSRVSSFFDDFYAIDAALGTTAADWRALGTGTPVAPLTVAGQFGRALFQPVAAVTDATYIQLATVRAAAAGSLPVGFFAGGTSKSDLWFQTLFQISDANLSVINAGFFPSIGAAADPGAAADGLFFTKASGTTSLSIKAIKTAGATTTSVVTTLANATDVKVGFHYSFISNTVFVYVNDVPSGSIVGDNVPTVGLLPLIGHQNNTANRTSNWDFVFAAQSRQLENVR